MYRIVITEEAQRDIDRHFEYILERNPQGAHNVYSVIVSRIHKLRDFPYATRQGSIPGTREAFTRYSYRVVFEVIGQEIAILHVMHGSEMWPPSDEEEGDE